MWCAAAANTALAAMEACRNDHPIELSAQQDTSGFVAAANAVDAPLGSCRYEDP